MRDPNSTARNEEKVMTISKVRDTLRSRIHKANFMTAISHLDMARKSFRSGMGSVKVTPRTVRSDQNTPHSTDQINQSYLVPKEVVRSFFLLNYPFMLFIHLLL